MDSPTDPASEYEGQYLSERIRRGLTINRHANIVNSYISDSISKSGEPDCSVPPPDPGRFHYGASRSHMWQTKRQANARLAGKTRVHKQMLMCWSAVMLDLLADHQPTVNEWMEAVGKDGRQTRRTKKDAPHLVHDLDQIVKWAVYRQDGTCSATPLKITRKIPKDERIQWITTPYSSPGALPGEFDLKAFADHAYIRRQGRFWEDALKRMSEWIGKGNAIRPDNEWLVRHIVNNDIAMHVIFDNLSFVCGVNWFERLGDKSRYEVAGRLAMTGREVHTQPLTVSRRG